MEPEVKTLTPIQAIDAADRIEKTWFFVKRSQEPMDVLAYFTEDGAFAIRDLSSKFLTLRQHQPEGRTLAEQWDRFRKCLESMDVTLPKQRVTGTINLNLPKLS